ncbi:SET domain-containing protein SmydA-8-like [Homarus americanus]|nr:SET domain-containing protein SmydA-8-like [Homarus americanus]
MGTETRLSVLESYLVSLTSSNPSWGPHDFQEKIPPTGTFTDRLQQEYNPTKRAQILRSVDRDGSFARDPVPDGPYSSGSTTDVSGAAVRIEWNPKQGRYLVAARDIKAGEVVFGEEPLVVAPKPGAGSTCLACLRALKESWVGCNGCGSPLCSPHCGGAGHTAEECKRLTGLGLKQDSSNKNLLIKQLNVLLTPLRTLLLMEKSPGKAAVIAALQSNADLRQKLPIGRFVEEKVAGPLRRQLSLQVGSDIVQHLCGVFDTNAFVISLGNNRCGRGLFPLGALMNHSCIPNTQHWYKDGVLIVRALKDIPKGESLTNTYAPTLWGTQARAAHLAGSKLFTCTCERCLDPTELCSHISSVACRGCKDGLLVPPYAPRGPWECHICGTSVSSGAVEAMVRAAGAAVSRVPQGDKASLSATVDHLSRVVGGGHYVTVELKFALVLAIMTQPLSDVTEDDLSRVVDLTKELLRLAACIDPGMSRFRGVLLLELIKSVTELMKRRNINCVASTAAATTTDTTSTTISADDLDDDNNSNEDGDSKDHSTTSLHNNDVQSLLKLMEECEAILQYDGRLDEVLPLKLDLQHLQHLYFTSERTTQNFVIGAEVSE